MKTKSIIVFIFIKHKVNENVYNNLNIQTPGNENEKVRSVIDSSDEDFKKYNNGRWHLSEHFRFIRGYILYGNNWKKVS